MGSRHEGQGGNIQIVSNVFLADPSSVIDASSALGIDGTVDIRAPITEISGTLVPIGFHQCSGFSGNRAWRGSGEGNTAVSL
jgi:hypothetical protein